jgi:hypothetical protein
MSPQTSRIEHSGRSGLELVLSRAAIDARFRRRLLVEPHAAIKEAFGIDLPSRLKLRFVERDPDADLMVVLPDLIDPGAPLDDCELDWVSGGAGWQWLLGPR